MSSVLKPAASPACLRLMDRAQTHRKTTNDVERTVKLVAESEYASAEIMVQWMWEPPLTS